MDVYTWHASLWQRLMSQPERLPHALLLEGPRGIGKRDFALALIAARLCVSPDSNGYACGHCAACHWIAQSAHPDLRVLEPLPGDDETEQGATRKKYEITIAQVRALGDFMNLSSHRAGSRMVLIHPAEALNPASANALLKTLEEPSPNSTLVLVSHQANSLLPTIISRCHRISMPQPTAGDAGDWLQRQGVEQASLCLALAGGAPLLARTYADPQYLQARQQFLTALQKPKQLNWLQLAEQGAKADMAVRFDWLQQWLTDLVMVRLAGKVRYNLDFVSGLQDLALQVNLMRIQKFADELAQIKRRLKHPLNPQLLLESVLLRYLAAVANP